MPLKFVEGMFIPVGVEFVLLSKPHFQVRQYRLNKFFKKSKYLVP